MRKLWQWFIPGYIMLAPLTLVGLLMALYYRPKAIHLAQGCIEFVLRDGKYLIGGKWVGAQTFGNVIFYRDDQCYMYQSLRVHERCHVVQAMVGSLVFALLYILHFAYNMAKGMGYDKAYRGIWFEKQAYANEDNKDSWGTW